MTKKIVIVGSRGQLGRAFVKRLDEQGRQYIALTREECDLSDPENVDLPLEEASALVNCAAYTNVDAAEADEAAARVINGDAVWELAKRCQGMKLPLVHFSTDYVFSGRANSPYRADQIRAPLGAYGRSKARGEELLEQSEAEHLLIRTSWVYAPWGNNFVRTMARLMREKAALRVVNDQRGRPTHVSCLAERALALLDGGHRGTFHVTDGGECTWFEFAREIAETIGAECQIDPCTTEEFPRPAKRPPYSVLDTSRADDILGPAMHYRDRLAAMKDTLEADR